MWQFRYISPAILNGVYAAYKWVIHNLVYIIHKYNIKRVHTGLVRPLMLKWDAIMRVRADKLG